MATIRDKGRCPCPRCKITKDNISGVATPDDMAARENLRRVDTDDRRKKVHDARKLIYEEGYVPNSTHVENLLKEESLVPTEVFLLISDDWFC